MINLFKTVRKSIKSNVFEKINLVKEKWKIRNEKPKEFVSYLDYNGPMDQFIGISMFWSDKIICLLLYLERVALITSWNLNWPLYYIQHFTWVFFFLLDFTTHHDAKDPILAGTKFDGCNAICKTLWPVICLPIFLLWVGISAHRTWQLYYTRNIERILWSFVVVGLIPFLNSTLRYFVLNQTGNIEKPESSWFTPFSEIGVLFIFVVGAGFLYFGYKRCAQSVLFRSRIRHEAFIRTKEIEYKLKFGASYRNLRVWMISSYSYAGWLWPLIRSGFDVSMLFLVVLAPPKVGIIIGCVFYGLEVIYFLLADIYRCRSSTIVEVLFSLSTFVYCVFGALQAYQVRNSLLPGRNLDYFLLALQFFVLLLFLSFLAYFFYDSHTFAAISIADKRAEEKWIRKYGSKGKGGEWIELRQRERQKNGSAQVSSDGVPPPCVLSANNSMNGSSNNSLNNGTDALFRPLPMISPPLSDDKPSSVALSSAATSTDLNDKFYLPKQSRFFTLNAASPHVWPVNEALINELLRRNEEDHLIDILRSVRRLLNKMSSADRRSNLIPTVEIKTHIFRLLQCVKYCKRVRVIHHINAIHPLQTTFEELLENLTFELRSYSERSLTKGHKQYVMIEVSRYLSKKMRERDKALALVSPMVRRILLKLMVLGLFLQLCEKRPLKQLEVLKLTEQQFKQKQQQLLLQCQITSNENSPQSSRLSITNSISSLDIPSPNTEEFNFTYVDPNSCLHKRHARLKNYNSIRFNHLNRNYDEVNNISQRKLSKDTGLGNDNDRLNNREDTTLLLKKNE